MLPTPQIKGNAAHLPQRKHCGQILDLEEEYCATEVNLGWGESP